MSASARPAPTRAPESDTAVPTDHSQIPAAYRAAVASRTAKQTSRLLFPKPQKPAPALAGNQAFGRSRRSDRIERLDPAWIHGMHGGSLPRQAIPYYTKALRERPFAYRGKLLGRELLTDAQTAQA